MLSALKQGERSAGELAEPFDMTFAAVSQHLRSLEEADLVTVRSEGRRRYYSLRPAPLRDVLTWIDEFESFFESRLDALGDYLDRSHGKPE